MRSIRFLLSLVLITGGLTAITLSAAPAQAANVAFSQCNGFASGGTGGATTAMNCDIEIVNTIDGADRSSRVTVTRSCAGGVDNACPGGGSNTGSGNTATVTLPESGDLVTTVNQCNGSANQSAIISPPIRCTVRITNNISADTAGVLQVATLNQCNDTTATAANACNPATATTSGATVAQCNESGQGGGGTVDCAFTLNSDMNNPMSKVFSNLPISINQCNGTGNPGGSYVVCNSFITTNIIPVVAPTISPTIDPTEEPTLPDETGFGGVTEIPVGGVATGGGSTAAGRQNGLLALGGALILGSILLLARTRFARR